MSPGVASAGGGQVLLSDSFTGATTANPVVGIASSTPDSSGFPCLTAGADTSALPIAGCNLTPPDAVGSGALRLTDTNFQEGSAVLYNTSVPTSEGLSITFHQYQYGGSGADGISFDLAVAPPEPTSTGAVGGSLGYAPDQDNQDTGLTPGMPAGWLGIGFDVFGNYLNVPEFEGSGCTDPGWAGWNPNQITVKGPGNGTVGYCLLSSSADAGGGLSFSIEGSTRADADRAVQITIDPVADRYTVGVDPSGGTSYTTVTSGPLPDHYYDQAGTLHAGLPPRITFGWSASTGALTDVHEITALAASTLNGSVPVLGLSKTDSFNQAPPVGSTFDYNIIPKVTSAGGPERDAVTVTDPMPAGVSAGTPSGPSWDCSASTSSNVACTFTGALPVAAGAALPTITVPVTLAPSVAAGTKVTNTATAISGDAALPVSASDTVTVATAAGLFGSGYWKNHQAQTSAVLARQTLYLGGYAVNSWSKAYAVLVASNCSNSSAQNAAGCLAAHLLTAELNLANGAPAVGCATAAVTQANQLLTSIGYAGPGGTYQLSSAQRATAVALAGSLNNYSGGSLTC